jgi:amino acid transporter
MRTAYRVVALLIALGVALQVASIALAGFTLANDAEDGATIDSGYSNFGQAYHSFGGTAIGLLALVLVIVSFLTNIRGGRMLAGIVIGMVILQIILAVVAFGLPALGVLHGINGMAIAAVASMAASRAAAPERQLATSA